MMIRILSVALIALVAGASCGKSSGNEFNNENNENNENNTNNENNPPTADCQDGDIGGEFDGVISEDLTFCGPVTLTGDMYNNGTARVTIRPGTRFILGVDRSVEFGWAGNEATITAQGTAENPIVFEGSAPNAGHWENIVIRNNVTSDSVFEHIVVRHAGSDRAAIINDNERGILFKNITVELSGSAGMASKSFKVGSENLTVRDSAGPVAILDHALAVTNFPLGGEYTDVDDLRVEVEFDTLTDDATFQNPGIPYFSRNGLYNNSEITVAFEPGVEVQFAVDKEFELGWAGNAGTLNINGTEEAPVKFLGSTPEAGHWEGLRINGSVTTDSTINNLEIWHAGAGDRYPATIESALTINGLFLAENELPAFELGEQGLRDGSSNINVENSDGVSAEIHSSAAHTLPADGSWGSATAVVSLVNGTLSNSGTLPLLNVPYLVEDSLYNNADITYEIETGTRLIFAADKHLELGWAGNEITFTADGIELVGRAGNAGDWTGVRWNNSVSSASFLRNSTISDASDPALRIAKDQGADLTGNTIENSSGYCIDKATADVTDYAADNTLNCTSGDITP